MAENHKYQFFNFIKNSFPSDQAFLEAFVKTMMIKAKADLKSEKKNTKEGFVYLMDNIGLTKIGETKDCVNKRLATFKVGNPDIKLIAYVFCEDRKLFEAQLHERYQEKHVKGEWFNLSRRDINNLIKEYQFIN